MAAPTDSGYGLGLGVHEGETEFRDVKSVAGLTAEDPIGFDEKNGSDEQDEEVPVAKKARVEKKVENGAGVEVTGDEVDEGAYDVDESVEGLVEKEDELDPLLGHNGTGESEERINGEGDDEEDSENGGVGAGEEEDEFAEGDAVTGKDAPGDVGLRTLLQEGDTTKSSSLNGTDLGDATHMLNGAK